MAWCLDKHRDNFTFLYVQQIQRRNVQTVMTLHFTFICVLFSSLIESNVLIDPTKIISTVAFIRHYNFLDSVS